MQHGYLQCFLESDMSIELEKKKRKCIGFLRVPEESYGFLKTLRGLEGFLRILQDKY